jgi:1,4-alpha-glucan branching enzyme
VDASLLPPGQDARDKLLSVFELEKAVYELRYELNNRPDWVGIPVAGIARASASSALYAYMWAHPGKKLLFMGGELAQEAEWSHERSLDWHLLEDPQHAVIQQLVRDLNHRSDPSLWEVDFNPAGFYWLEPNDASNNVLAFAPASRDHERVLVFAANLSPVPRGPYRLGLPRSGRWRELLNTDSTFYGGSDTANLGGIEAEPIPWHGQPFSAEIALPPLAALWLVPEQEVAR